MRATVRVVLHDATWDHYILLHKAMAAKGMVDILTGSDGKRVKMPDGEYNYEGNLDRDQVLAQAKAAAASTGRKFAVLVTESNGRVWEGLEAVK